MNYRFMFLIHALFAILLGLGLLIMPNSIFGQPGAGADAASGPLSRFLGVVILGLGLLLWFAKDMTEVNLQEGIGIGLLIADAAGLMITIMGTTAGMLRANWWIVMALYTVLGLSNAYLMFLRPKPLHHG